MPISLAFFAGSVPWLVAPVLSRWLRRRRAGGHLKLRVWVSCLAQDAATSGWFIILNAVLARLVFAKSPWISAIMSAAFFAAVQMFQVADTLVWHELGVRLRADILGYARALLTSGRMFRYAAALLVASWLALTWVIALVLLRWPRQPSELTAGWVGATVAATMLAWVAERRLSQDETLRWSPLSWLIAADMAQRWRRAFGKAGGARQAVHDIPDSEESVPVGEAFPLLRFTRGFVGEPRFQFRQTPDRPRHVVFLFLESFRGHDVGTLGGPAQVTPCFDALSREGVLFTRFYTHSGSTSRALLSTLYGVLPGAELAPLRAAARPPPLLGVPHIMNSHGYFSAFFSGAPLTYEETGPFVRSHGFHAAFDGRDIARAIPRTRGTKWGPYDEYLLEYHANWLHGQRAMALSTFSAVFTITNHYPWDAADDWPWPRQPQTKGEAQSHYLKHLRTMHYSDRCLGAYVQQLRRLGLENDVLLFVLGDTGQVFDPRSQRIMHGGVAPDAMYHVPLLIWSPGRMSTPQRIDDVSGQVDVLPTLMDMLNMQHLQHAMGRSLMRRSPTRPVPVGQPWASGFWGLRMGDMRYNYIPGRDMSTLYDLQADPQETTDLSQQYPTEVATWRTLACDTRNLTCQLFEQHRFVDKAIVQSLEAPIMQRLIPNSLADAQSWLDALQSADDSSAQKSLVTILRGYLGAPLDEQRRLRYLQLRLRKFYRDCLGPLSAVEEAEWRALEQEVDQINQTLLQQIQGSAAA